MRLARDVHAEGASSQDACPGHLRGDAGAWATIWPPPVSDCGIANPGSEHPSRGTPSVDSSCIESPALSTKRSPRVLVADDQADIREALRLLCKAEGWACETASSPAAVIAAVAVGQLDVALIDLNYSRDTTSGGEGLGLIAELQRLDPQLPVVVMTAWSSVEGAVAAVRAGARDYVEKPWDNERLVATLRTQIELGRVLRRSRLLEDENRRLRGNGLPDLIAAARAMEPVLRMIDRVGPSDASVLVTGEHGTGKEVVARLLHAASSRADRPLVTINAGGLPDGVFESELFGHTRGAFTDAKESRVGSFELADGGTLLLDEIGNMPLGQQGKLLRVLQTGEFHPVGSSRVRKVDVRVIAATNADLRAEVKAGRFREDLLYRLNTVEIVVPPLRERIEDLLPLAHRFLRRGASRYGKGVEGFTSEAEHALLHHPWPGNVRELEHAIERAVLLCEGARVQTNDLGLARTREGVRGLESLTLDEAEAQLIRRALERNDGNVSQAATELGVSRSALYRRLQRYGLAP
ncbi:MAG: sigma-54-dependent Fis family transcriptional regulator [Deltaproteobacteria bacterium]|nr:sigma-54-dependent Fis family transcriptional regulator [Nannocystaceae bacterium]